MKIIETKEEMRPKKITIRNDIICDKCNTNIIKYSTGCFDAYKCTIEIKTGENYPEGGNGELYTIDICQNCFLSDFLNLMEKNGYRINKEDWDY